MKILPTTNYSLDDIVFEGRHQAYGAYALRKAYPQHVLKATTYMFAAVGLFWAAAHLGLALKSEPLPATRPNTNIITIETVVLPKTEERVIEQPATQPPRPAEVVAATKRVITTRIVPDHTPVKEEIPAPTDLTAAEPGLEEALGELTAGTITATANPGPTVGNAADGTATVRDFVEQMPEFPGGMKQMYAFIRRNLRYPDEARRLGLEGTVVVTFVVSKTGEISDIKVMKDVGGGTAEETIRVIRNMKPWVPGRQNGQTVPVRFTLPLRFSLAS